MKWLNLFPSIFRADENMFNPYLEFLTPVQFLSRQCKWRNSRRKGEPLHTIYTRFTYTTVPFSFIMWNRFFKFLLFHVDQHFHQTLRPHRDENVVVHFCPNVRPEGPVDYWMTCSGTQQWILVSQLAGYSIRTWKDNHLQLLVYKPMAQNIESHTMDKNSSLLHFESLHRGMFSTFQNDATHLNHQGRPNVFSICLWKCPQITFCAGSPLSNVLYGCVMPTCLVIRYKWLCRDS
jgi:hypothetical protein